MYLIIDIGNTQVKTAVFKDELMVDIEKFTIAKLPNKIGEINDTYTIKKALISSVGKLSKSNKKILYKLFNCIELNQKTHLPFINKYATPKTLGVDRIALASAAAVQFPKANVLIIDAGTCITYDFLSQDKKYLGGAIAPGVQSRYKALHNYTENLPLLEKQLPDNFIGDSTTNSIHSGVVNGICREIDGVITQYKDTYEKLTVVLTGGDAKFLSSQLKSSIFARPFFLLEGLYTILKLNK